MGKKENAKEERGGSCPIPPDGAVSSSGNVRLLIHRRTFSSASTTSTSTSTLSPHLRVLLLFVVLVAMLDNGTQRYSGFLGTRHLRE